MKVVSHPMANTVKFPRHTPGSRTSVHRAHICCSFVLADLHLSSKTQLPCSAPLRILHWLSTHSSLSQMSSFPSPEYSALEAPLTWHLCCMFGLFRLVFPPGFQSFKTFQHFPFPFYILSALPLFGTIIDTQKQYILHEWKTKSTPQTSFHKTLISWQVLPIYTYTHKFSRKLENTVYYALILKIMHSTH